MESIDVVRRLVEATNAHDLEALVGCFAEDYSVEMPVHPSRSFRGNQQVRRNWEQIFGAVPDIQLTLLGTAVDGDTVWTDQEMSGTRRDGSAHLMRGPVIFRVRDGLIASARFYAEPVDTGATSIDQAVRSHVGQQ